MNELLILVGGMVEVLKPGAEGSEELSIDLDGYSSVRGTYTRCLSTPLSIKQHPIAFGSQFASNAARKEGIFPFSFDTD